MLSRGSEWNRWDLHVHTPQTALEDMFSGGWERYLDVVESQTEVKAIGVTDYLSIDNYETLLIHKMNGRLRNINILIPNIEFRITPATRNRAAINVHLLISPHSDSHVDETRRALSRLTFDYNGGRYACVRGDLVRLGHAHSRSSLSEEAAYRDGVNQFKIEFNAFRQWYSEERWLSKNSLVAVSGGADGLSGISQGDGFGAIREEISRFSHIIFSGRPGERDFWLGRGSEEERQTLSRLGGSKPCIHGSDAHTIERLFKPDGDRYCWIKDDLTFDGLRQILYEPGDRVYIGVSAPSSFDESRVLASVAVKSPSGWFPSSPIPIGRGLVAIIGQKGMGKSALGEIVAFGCGVWHGDDGGSFLARAHPHLKGSAVELVWSDGAIDRCQLGVDMPDHKKAQYLSQRFVERLCSDDHHGSELVAEVEALIFSYLDPVDTLNAADFPSLRALRTEALREGRARTRTEMLRLVRERELLRRNAVTLPQRKARSEALALEAEGLRKQLPATKSQEETATRDALEQYRTRLATLQKMSGANKQARVTVAKLAMNVDAFQASMDQFFVGMTRSLKELRVKDEFIAEFKPKFAGNPKDVLARLDRSISTRLAEREGDTLDPGEDTIRYVQARIEELSKRLSEDKAQQERINAIQTRLSEIATEVDRIKAEMAAIRGVEAARRRDVTEAIIQNYLEMFASLKEEEKILADLYEPVRAKLDEIGGQERSLDFYIRWDVDFEEWIAQGSMLFDQRKTQPFKNLAEMERVARETLLPVWQAADPDGIRKAVIAFMQPFLASATSNFARSNVTMQHILEWIFSVEHIHLTYGLRYNGTELEKLSPGTKGIVLLILYLGIDRKDSRPLIIDQPEGNLDSESVYALLTKFFRDAKLHRQILLITHNPNLVVNTDAEQVIVAEAERRGTGLPKFSYIGGGLEHSQSGDGSIRGHVCRILEGGEGAFNDREKRYGLTKR